MVLSTALTQLQLIVGLPGGDLDYIWTNFSYTRDIAATCWLQLQLLPRAEQDRLFWKTDDVTIQKVIIPITFASHALITVKENRKIWFLNSHVYDKSVLNQDHLQLGLWLDMCWSKCWHRHFYLTHTVGNCVHACYQMIWCFCDHWVTISYNWVRALDRTYTYTEILYIFKCCAVH